MENDDDDDYEVDDARRKWKWWWGEKMNRKSPKETVAKHLIEFQRWNDVGKVFSSHEWEEMIYWFAFVLCHYIWYSHLPNLKNISNKVTFKKYKKVRISRGRNKRLNSVETYKKLKCIYTISQPNCPFHYLCRTKLIVFEIIRNKMCNSFESNASQSMKKQYRIHRDSADDAQKVLRLQPWV